MPSTQEIEESAALHLDFDKLISIGRAGHAVVPAVVQDAGSLEVLLVAYVDREALRLSLLEKRAVFYSTSRGALWRKGDTSGDILDLREIRVNCEQNSLLFLVEKRQKGSCHTKNSRGESRGSCYYRRLGSDQLLEFLER